MTSGGRIYRPWLVLLLLVPATFCPFGCCRSVRLADDQSSSSSVDRLLAQEHLSPEERICLRQRFDELGSLLVRISCIDPDETRRTRAFILVAGLCAGHEDTAERICKMLLDLLIEIQDPGVLHQRLAFLTDSARGRGEWRAKLRRDIRIRLEAMRSDEPERATAAQRFLEVMDEIDRIARETDQRERDERAPEKGAH